jgi:hypothetical protein
MKAKKVTLTVKNRNTRSKRSSRGGNDDNLHQDAGDDSGHRDSGRALGVVGQDGSGEVTQPLEEPDLANVGTSDLEKEVAAMKGKHNWNC